MKLFSLLPQELFHSSIIFQNVFVLNQSSFCTSSKMSLCSSNWPPPLLHCVPRLYSDYLYFTVGNKSAEDFHLKVVESVQLFHSCLSEWTIRYCAYDTSLSNAMPVNWHDALSVNRLNTSSSTKASVCLSVCWSHILGTAHLISYALGKSIVDFLRKCRAEFVAIWTRDN